MSQGVFYVIFYENKNGKQWAIRRTRQDAEALAENIFQLSSGSVDSIQRVLVAQVIKVLRRQDKV